MNVAERQRQNEASRAKVEALMAERQPARRGKSRQPTSKLERLQRRQARLADRQQPRHVVLVAVPSGRHLPLPPWLRPWIGGLIASCSATMSLRSGSIRIVRRDSPPPSHIVEAVSDHAGPIAAWLRSRQCPACDRPARIQPAPEVTAGASWAITCPACGDAIHPQPPFPVSHFPLSRETDR